MRMQWLYQRLQFVLADQETYNDLNLLVLYKARCLDECLLILFATLALVSSYAATDGSDEGPD